MSTTNIADTIDPVVSRLIARLTQTGMSHGSITKEIAHETGCTPENAIVLHSQWLAGLASRMEQVTARQPLAVGDIVARPDTSASLFAAVVHIGDNGITLKAGRSYWTLTRPPRVRYRPLPPAPQTSEAWVIAQLARDGFWDPIGEASEIEGALHLMSSNAISPYDAVAVMSGKLWRMGERSPIVIRYEDSPIAVKLG